MLLRLWFGKLIGFGVFVPFVLLFSFKCRTGSDELSLLVALKTLTHVSVEAVMV